nr:Protein AAR2 homolog [Euglena gracilis]
MLLTNEQAVNLCKHGGTLLVLDFPSGGRFGIDTASWTTQERFLGVKMIPPGVHLVHFGSSSESTLEVLGNAGSLFLHFEPGAVLVWRWAATEECLVGVPEEEAERYARAAREFEFDAQLGPYPLAQLQSWRRLADHLSPAVLARLAPLGRCVRPSAQPPAAAAADSDAAAEGPPGAADSTIYYTPFDLRVAPGGLTPAEVTRRAMDKSYVLDALEKRLGRPEELLGELQYAFLSFWVGQSYESFEQWKKLLLLLCSCDDALHEERYHGPPGEGGGFFVAFFRALQSQVKHLPPDFLTSDLGPRPTDHFLVAALRSLFELLADDTLPEELRVAGERLRRAAEVHWSLDLAALGAEDGPVVV